MKRIMCSFTAIIAFALLFTTMHVQAEEKRVQEKRILTASATKNEFTTAKKGDYVGNEMILQFKQELDTNTISSFKRKYHIESIKKLKQNRYYLLTFTLAADTKALSQKLLNDPLVSKLQPNYIFKQAYTPSDSGYAKQWHLKKIGANKAWDSQKGASSVVVAVIDDGLQLNHPDFKGRIYRPYDVIDGTNSHYPSDHGTHVAGIIAGSINKKGIVGVAPNVKIMPINVFGSQGASSIDVASGIYYAVSKGADVINMSLGSYDYNTYIADAVNYAASKGVIMIAAAGNDNTSLTAYPAGYYNVMGISATNSSDYITDFSNYGYAIDFAAPGENIYSSLPSNSYGYLDGTSMASPVVAGTTALVLSKNPLLTFSDVYNILANSAADYGPYGWDNYYGYGRINAYQALKNTPAALSAIKVSSTKYTMTGSNQLSASFSAFGGASITAYIKDAKGKTVKTLLKSKGGSKRVVWDGKSAAGGVVPSGKYELVVRAAGNQRTLSRSVKLTVVDKVKPVAVPTASAHTFSPKVSKSLVVKFKLNKSSKLTVKVYDSKGKIVRVLADKKNFSAGSKSITWNGKNGSGKAVADGSYKIKFNAVDSSKNAGKQTQTTVTLDSKAPSVKGYAMSPAVLKIGKDSGIKGKVTTNETTTFTVYVANSKNNKSRKMVTNKSYKSGTHYFTWDGKSDKKAYVGEGKYKFVYEAKDAAGNKSTASSGWLTLQDWTAPAVTGNAASYNLFDRSEPLRASYSLNKPGKVTVQIKQGGTLVKTIETNVSKAKGAHAFTWNGTNASGTAVSDGAYQYVLTFTDAYGQVKTASGKINVSFTEVQIEHPSSVRYYADNTGSEYAASQVYYKISQDAYVTTEILDAYGSVIRTIESKGLKTAEVQWFEWDGYNDEGYNSSYYHSQPFSYRIKATLPGGSTKTAEGILEEDAYPEWLTSSTSQFLYDSYNEVSGIEITNDSTANAFLDLYLWDDYNTEVLDSKSFDIKKGSSKAVYSKPSHTIGGYGHQYIMLFIDSLGNNYGYYIEEDNSSYSSSSLKKVAKPLSAAGNKALQESVKKN